MDLIDYLVIQRESEMPITSVDWFLSQEYGTSILEDILDLAEDVWDSTRYLYTGARIAFAAPFVFGAAALLTIANQVDALLFDGIAH